MGPALPRVLTYPATVTNSGQGLLKVDALSLPGPLQQLAQQRTVQRGLDIGFDFRTHARRPNERRETLNCLAIQCGKLAAVLEQTPWNAALFFNNARRGGLAREAVYSA